MKYTLRVLLIVVVIFLLIGFSRGWFFITSNQEAAPDRMNVNLTIDADKMKSDANRVGEAASDLTGETPTKTDSTDPEKSDPVETEPVPDPATNPDSAFPREPVSPELAK